MPLPPICVWFNGYPGVGKTTVAEKILWLTGFDSLTIVDIDTLILDVKIDLPKDDPNYEKEFEKAIKEQREKGISKYLEDTKKYEYLIFTDCQFDDKEGRSIAEYYKTEAEKNGRVFIPIKLHCYDMDNLRRVENPDRMLRGSHKILDRKVLQEMLDIPLKIYGFEGHKHALTFDISLFPPYQSASRLMEHIYGIAMDNLVPHTWP